MVAIVVIQRSSRCSPLRCHWNSVSCSTKFTPLAHAAPAEATAQQQSLRHSHHPASLSRRPSAPRRRAPASPQQWAPSQARTCEIRVMGWARDEFWLTKTGCGWQSATNIHEAARAAAPRPAPAATVNALLRHRVQPVLRRGRGGHGRRAGYIVHAGMGYRVHTTGYRPARKAREAGHCCKPE